MQTSFWGCNSACCRSIIATMLVFGSIIATMLVSAEPNEQIRHQPWKPRSMTRCGICREFQQLPVERAKGERNASRTTLMLSSALIAKSPHQSCPTHGWECCATLHVKSRSHPADRFQHKGFPTFRIALDHAHDCKAGFFACS